MAFMDIKITPLNTVVIVLLYGISAFAIYWLVLTEPWKTKPRNIAIGMDSMYEITTGTNYMPIGHDPNYTGFVYRQTLPDGTVVETKEPTVIGYQSLKKVPNGASNVAI